MFRILDLQTSRTLLLIIFGLRGYQGVAIQNRFPGVLFKAAASGVLVLSSRVLASWCPGIMAGLVLTQAGDEVNFDALFHNMLTLLAAKAEVKDENGNAKFADLCEFLCAEFPGTDERAQFSQKLQELDRKCCSILGAEAAAASFTMVVPSPPAGPQPVGQPLSTHWVHLWQLGFAENSAVRGLKLSI